MDSQRARLELLTGGVSPPGSWAPHACGLATLRARMGRLVVWLCLHLSLAVRAVGDHVFARALSGDAVVGLLDSHVALGVALDALGVRSSATADTGVTAALAQHFLAATRLT